MDTIFDNYTAPTDYYTILMPSQVFHNTNGSDMQYDQIVFRSVPSYAASPCFLNIVGNHVITFTNGQTTRKPRIGGTTDSWAGLSSVS